MSKMTKTMAKARAIRDELYPNGEWRNKEGQPSKHEIVSKWRKSHPDGRKIDCERDTGLSRHTVLKWWNKADFTDTHTPVQIDDKVIKVLAQIRHQIDIVKTKRKRHKGLQRVADSLIAVISGFWHDVAESVDNPQIDRTKLPAQLFERMNTILTEEESDIKVNAQIKEFTQKIREVSDGYLQ